MIWFIINLYLVINLKLHLFGIKDAKLKAWVFQTLDICAKNNGVDVKWLQSGALLQRLRGLKISVRKGAKTGVLSRETNWSN